MSILNKEKVIPLASLLCGVAATLMVADLVRQPETQLLASAERFSKLSPREQEDIYARAKSYSGNFREAERKRAEAIHEAVQQDPELLKKLKQLDELLKTADEETRAKLKPNGEFSENWVDLVTSFAEQQSKTVPTIEVRFPWPGSSRERDVLEFSETQFERFLEDAIPSPAPESLQNRLNDFRRPELHNERVLTKILWLIRELRSPDGVDAQAVTDAVERHLVTDVRSPTGERIVGFLRWRPTFGGPGPDGRSEPGRPQPGNGGRPGDSDQDRRQAQLRFLRMKPMLFLRDPLRHYESRFNATYLPTNSDLAELFGQELNRDRQLALMRMDPVEAEKELHNKVIEHLPNSDQAIVALNGDLQEVNQYFRERLWEMARGRGGSSRGSSNRRRGSDERPFDGREDSRFRPPGEDRGPEPPDQRSLNNRPPATGQPRGPER